MFLSNGQIVTKTPFSLTDPPSSSYFPYMPAMSGGWPSVYAEMYRCQQWVYVLVNKLATAEARLPMPVYQRSVKDGRKRVDDHPMAKLLDNPNPGLSGYALKEWTSATENIHGHAFWWKKRKAGKVVGLYPLHPTHMSVSDDRWTFNNGKTVMRDIPDSDLVHFSRFESLSPLEPLRSTLENEWSARNATSSFWARGARPAMALTHEQNLSAAAQARLKAQIDNVHSGSGNTGSTLILEEGMKPQVMTLTAEEAQYIETRKLNREEICAVYDVPPPVVHILDHATFSNITEQMRSMYRDTMAPPLSRHEATIELELRRVEWPEDDVYAEYLLDAVLRGDFEARQTALKMADHMTIAEKRRIENLPFIEGTDRIFLNTATMPLDAIDAKAKADAEAASRPDPVPVVAPEPQVPVNAPVAPAKGIARTVMGRLSWQKSLDDVDGMLLVKDLDEDHAGAVLIALHRERKYDGTVAGLRDRIRTELDA
jgi:HK97 family phage portal protein